MKKGSITVFLSLILVLIFSFLLTTLEAARIRGATAYISMVTELAGDSLLASYYYPVFQNYRLFGIHAGNEKGHFSEDILTDTPDKNICSALEDSEGALLHFQNTSVALTEYKTLLADGEKGFLSQIREQAVLDGLGLMLEELFSAEQFEEAGTAGQIIREQEEALQATATVTKELLNLMELVDGIRMNDNGIHFDRNGRMQAEESFIKQLIPMEKWSIRNLYDNEEVYEVTSGYFFRVETAAKEVLNFLAESERWEKKITSSENRIERYEKTLESLENTLSLEGAKETPDEKRLDALEESMHDVENSIETEEKRLDNYEEKRNLARNRAKSKYKNLQKKLQSVENLLSEALKVVERLEKKQKAAGLVVEAYEVFLEGREEKLSPELYAVFLSELDKMKLYAGLTEGPFSIHIMKASLTTDYELLQSLSLSGFSEKNLQRAEQEMERITSRMKEYTLEGLWFPYGDILVAETTAENIGGALGELLSEGILSLTGVPKEKQSSCKLDGKDLPSAGLEEETQVGELIACMEEVAALFRNGGMGEVLAAAGNSLLDSTVLELYSTKYFHCFGEESPYTKLKYEREYLVFGSEKDKANLLTMVLHLIAIRTLFSLVALLKQPEKMEQIEALTTAAAGLTGITVLSTVVKYTVLLLWSVEEALVEVSALLQGKRIPVAGEGTVSFEELFIFNKAMIERKAAGMPDGIGAEYKDYLTLLSLTKGTKRKAYRAMDLIQENIRCRYNDGFRIRNVVTAVSFTAETELKMLFDTGLFSGQAYIFCAEEEVVY